jgi:ribosomal protein S25
MTKGNMSADEGTTVNETVESWNAPTEEEIQRCIEAILSEGKATVCMLQRRFKMGYVRAVRIMEELERRGVVGPAKGVEPRDVLIKHLKAAVSIGRTHPGDGEGVITFDIEWSGGWLRLEMSLADFALALTGRGATPAAVRKWKGAR